MTLRASSYNIYVPIPDDERVLLVHGLTGAVDLAVSYTHLTLPTICSV